MAEIWGIAIAGVAAGAGAIIAGGEQASGDKTAANTQAQMYNTTVGQEQPFLQGGYGAETTLNQLLGTSPTTGAGGTAAGTSLPGGYLNQTFNPTQSQLENYPGYQFQLQQGDLATQSANSAGGSALSGPALKSLMTFNQGLAASNYSNYFNQFQTQQNNIYNRLQGIASLGQNAAGNLGSAGASLGTGEAQAQAAGSAAIAGGITGATNSAGQSILLSNLLNPSGTLENNGYGNPALDSQESGIPTSGGGTAGSLYPSS